MKYYTLVTIADGKTTKFNKKFNTRNSAINYAYNYLEKNYINDSIDDKDEFNINDDKHNIEYVLNYDTRFRINRVVA